jgi:hypothetical protein
MPIIPILCMRVWEFRRTAWSFSSGGTKSALYKTIDGGKRNKIHNGFVKEIRKNTVTIAPYQF